MNAQEYEIIEPIENDSEDDEEEDDDDEKEEVYVEALQISKLSLGKEEIQQNDEQYSNALPSTVGQVPLSGSSQKKLTLEEEEDEDEEDEVYDRLGQTPFEVQLHSPQIIASNPSPLLLPWQDLTIEYIWQVSRALPASAHWVVIANDAWTIEPAASPPAAVPFNCSTGDDFARVICYHSSAQLALREASKGTITLKTPIITGEWVVNQYIHLDKLWKHVGRTPAFRTLDAKIRLQATVEDEDETAVFVTVRVYRQEMKRQNDHIIVVRRQDFPDDQMYVKAGERKKHLEEDYLEVTPTTWPNGGVLAVVKLMKSKRIDQKEGEEEKKGVERILLYVTDDLQDRSGEKQKKILGRSRPFLVPFL